MPTDYTQQQTVGEQMRAEELSLRATVPPTQIPGYRIDNLLGQGAFGQVWVGTDLNTGRSVAVKFYLHRSGVNWSLLAREVKNLVTMSANRFIVQVLDVGWDAEPPYYVMEFLENGSLDDHIRQRGTIGVSRAVEIFTDIALGLNHSHGKGVLHCDLKPANVLLDQDLRPRLADFGQSRMSTEQTPSLGTLFYMAPEQADLNALPDARWDVYALGAILYCMLVGTPPHRTPQTVTSLDTASSLPERLSRYRETILKASSPRAHYRISGIDRSLTAIIDRCIAKNPSDRFGNVQQLIGALERRQASKLRQPLLMLGIVAPLILLGVTGFFAWRGIYIAEREATQQIREIAMERNKETANFAASAVESQIERLFRTLESEADRSEFADYFVSFRDAAGSDLLSSLATEEPPPESFSKLLALDQRTELEEYLQSRFEKILDETAKTSLDEDRFNSLFVTDRFGNMVASAFADSQETNKVGWNFAYRSYFSGQRQDSPVTVPRRNIGPTSVSHVSVPFMSTTTQRWKIAVCTPIFIDSDDDAVSVEGVMVLTINLGNFELISSEDGKRNRAEKGVNEDVLAVLVDGHEGRRNGTVLQHPMLHVLSQQLDNDGELIMHPYQLTDEQMYELQENGSFDYRDPFAKHPLGKQYDGEWIATMRQVDVSRRRNQSDSTERKYNTDLYVLVQERADAAVKPVSSLVRKLFREGWFALLSTISLILLLWFFVFRALRLPEQSSIGARIRSNTEPIGTAANEATIDITN
ncbi:MAG: protein kinase [Pirellulaceae bacterium]|nr:protein kinase [Pirellulaceae bacterium]